MVLSHFDTFTLVKIYRLINLYWKNLSFVELVNYIVS